MIESNPTRVSRTTNRRTAGSCRAAAKGHTVARYRLHLVKEDKESISEPESLTRPAEVAAFLWRRIFDGLDREAMCAVYADNLCRVIGWTVAYVGCLTRCSVEPRGLVVPALLSNAVSLCIAHYVTGHIMGVMWRRRLCSDECSWARNCQLLSEDARGLNGT
jgi:RadC-like JAB domain-containing protein